MATQVKRGPGLRGFPGFAAGTDNTNPPAAPATPVVPAGAGTDAPILDVGAPAALSDTFVGHGISALGNMYSPAAPLDNAVSGPAPVAAPAAAPSVLDPNMVQPSSLAQALSADAPPGQRVSTTHTGETNPGIHTAQDWARANSHLTPLDLQMLMSHNMSPHDRMVQDVSDTHASMRQVALDAAMKKPEGPARDAALTKAYEDDVDRKLKVLSAGLYGGALGVNEIQNNAARRAAAGKRGLAD